MEKEMYKSLGYAGAFALLFLVLFLLLNALYAEYVLKRTGLWIQDEQFSKSKPDVKILFLGDSSTQADVNPAFIPGSFNYGLAGETYMQTYYKLRFLLNDSGFEPEVIVLPLNLHSFSSYRASRVQDVWYWHKFIDYEELWYHFDEVYPFKEYIKSAFPIIGGGEKLVASLFEGGSREMALGHLPMHDRFSMAADKDGIASQRAAYHFRNASILHPGMIHYFQKTLALAQKRNITVILVKFPVTDTYLSIASGYIPDTKGFYGILGDYYGNVSNTYLLDYQRWNYTNHFLFADSVHLNDEGSAQFSRQLAADIAIIRRNASGSG